MTSSKPIQPLAHVADGTRQIANKPQRRSFTWDYKKAILEQLDAVRGEHGAMSKIMRREGLYPAQVATWRNEALKRANGNFEPSKRGRKPDPSRDLKHRIAKLEKENAKLLRENHIQRTLVEFLKKSCSVPRNRNLFELIQEYRTKGCSLGQLLKAVKVPKSTYFSWLDRNPQNAAQEAGPEV